MNAGKPIEVSGNNTDFSIDSDILTSQIELQESLINIMIMAPMRLTHVVIKSMEKNYKCYKINVSNVAGYMAWSTYCSAKSWLTVFTESIYSELKSKSISIHAICPGFTKT